MINAIKIRNFKAFEDSGKVEIKKINVFVGPNSSGKSSIIKSILTLKNSNDSKDEDEALEFVEEIGTYPTVVHKNDTTKSIEYRLYFNLNMEKKFNLEKTVTGINLFNIAKQISKKEGKEIDEIIDTLKKINRDSVLDNIDIVFGFTKSSKHTTVKKFVVRYKDKRVFEIKKERSSYYITLENKDIRIANIALPYKFYFKLDENKIDGNHNDLTIDDWINLSIMDNTLNNLERYIGNFTNNIRYIGPLRNRLERSQYVTKVKNLSTVGSRGESTLNTLISIDESENDKKSMDDIKYWLDIFELAKDIDIKELGDDTYSLTMKNKHTNIVNNIVDFGVGTSQLLPIIVESVNSPSNSTLIIEEPEIHIHPNAQSILADLFVSCSKSNNKRFIIETHSIFLVTKLQILVAKGEIDVNDVCVYYVNQDERGSHVMDMKLSNNGQFEEEWPSGFFDIHYKLGKELFKFM
ncbi:AAA family ATPase [Paraclostridium bifermentans]